jgi:hypothetical protein
MSALPPGAVTNGSLHWSGHWIGHQPRAVAETPADFLTGGEVNREFSRSMFRRTFDLQTLATEAPGRITADSRYVLWVNGHEVGRGPVRSQPYRQRYDSYDLAQHLSLGANVIAVLVTYYGRTMSFWQPAPAGSNTDAALVFEVRIGDETLISDDTGVSSARLPGRCWSVPVAAKVYRSRSSMPGRSRRGGARSNSDLPVRPPPASGHLPARRRTGGASPRTGFLDSYSAGVEK